MTFRPLSRRKFIRRTLLSGALGLAAYTHWVEPGWVKVRQLRVGKTAPTHRFVHFTDVHYKGDRAYLQSVVATINSLRPEFVCFTGDIIEEGRYLPEALELLAGIKAPLFGVPGNHDYWSRVSFAPIQECFAATGGGWLLDETRLVAQDTINLIGITCRYFVQPRVVVQAGVKNILLMHYPAWVKRLGDQQFDLMLAGHSHGGQVRIPFYGAPFVPFLVDEYDLGRFELPQGTLYVNPGIGWYPLPVRFNCRPEITVIEI